MTIELEHVTLAQKIEHEVANVSNILLDSASLNFPLLNGLLKSIIKSGGKRLRPQMALLAARAAEHAEQIDTPKLLQVAAAIEMLHTATLVHDDTLDEAMLRRGNPTLNSALSENMVILVGDYLFAQSAILITRPGNPRVVQIFAECLATICDGELTQMFSTHQASFSREGYFHRIYAKTAVLFATACELGAIMGGADEKLSSTLREFGRLFGIGFQIIDDIIDFKPTEVTGKATGGDLREGIVTLPTMYFFENGKPADVNFVKKIILSTEAHQDSDIMQAVELIGSTNAFEQAFTEARDYINQAKALLDTLPDNEAIRTLRQIADYALRRDK
jgi:geranylgeranyl pyrophosphate synthase